MSLPAARAQTGGTSLGRELRNLGFKILAVVAVCLLMLTFVYGFHRNSEPGMLPAVRDGDMVLFYRFDKDYAVGDLLLLEFQGQKQVRRVVAQAGDVVDFSADGLLINGALQQEREIYQPTRPYEAGIAFPVTLGLGQVFVLGDARANATDSRIYGPVEAGDTFGTVVTVIRWRGF